MFCLSRDGWGIVVFWTLVLCAGFAVGASTDRSVRRHGVLDGSSLIVDKPQADTIALADSDMHGEAEKTEKQKVGLAAEQSIRRTHSELEAPPPAAQTKNSGETSVDLTVEIGLESSNSVTGGDKDGCVSWTQLQERDATIARLQNEIAALRTGKMSTSAQLPAGSTDLQAGQTATIQSVSNTHTHTLAAGEETQRNVADADGRLDGPA
jgi:hypothetical protein